MAHVVTWDGSTLPEELQGLPAGRYLFEPLDDAVDLTPDEEAGIEAALASLRAGAGVADEAARQRVEAATRR